ncbi:MAG TPA: aminotransferase class III-fold pyridoxal phosphate-dependent enzyme [Methylomirabilota bacterium]|jgi:glutamate-1-semialdehyde aminotransferase
MEERHLDRSSEWLKRALAVIPSATQTFSKGRRAYVEGVGPAFVARARGSHVWDVDGHEYIDYPMGLGAVTLGHAYPAVNEAVTRQLAEGVSFSVAHPLEVALAETLTEILPGADMVRFGKNGSDATSGAVRAARALTGRDVIACCGYHGWQDWYIATTTRAAGIPKAVRELTVPFAYNDLASLERVFADHRGRVAAVIMEPVGVVPPAPGFLQAVRDLAHREGALLIFDEIVTGFRLALGGAQEMFGVIPDLSCFGKGMGNGFPIAAVVGRRDLMEVFDQLFFSFTFGGEAASLAAALATVREMCDKPVIPHLWRQGERLRDGFNALARAAGLGRHAECVGYPPRTVITFADPAGGDPAVLKTLFLQEAIKRGILLGGGMNVSFSHDDDDVTRTLAAYEAALAEVAAAVKAGDAARRLQGRVVEPVFRKP